MPRPIKEKGKKYGIESAVFAELLQIVQRDITAKEVKEQLNMLYVKHALLIVSKMNDEGDCISDNEIEVNPKV